MRSYAILIDAGFLKRKLGSQRDPVTAEKIALFLENLQNNPHLTGLTVHRIYYYDAPPLEISIDRPLNGGPMKLGETSLARANKALLSHLARMPFVALRLGDLNFRGWRIRERLPENQNTTTITSNDIAPDIQQKGVDMRIGLDIASLTLKQQVNVIVLVTGDSDFIPAMKFARREGAQLFVVTLGHAVKDGLFEHADLTLSVAISGEALS